MDEKKNLLMSAGKHCEKPSAQAPPKDHSSVTESNIEMITDHVTWGLKWVSLTVWRAGANRVCATELRQKSYARGLWPGSSVSVQVQAGCLSIQKMAE